MGERPGAAWEHAQMPGEFRELLHGEVKRCQKDQKRCNDQSTEECLVGECFSEEQVRLKRAFYALAIPNLKHLQPCQFGPLLLSVIESMTATQQNQQLYKL